MAAIPKYEDYSLRELYQVLNSIRGDRYPEVYAALEKEIASRTPASVAELEDCYYALDRKRNPDYAERLVEQIYALGGPARERVAEFDPDTRYRTFWRRFWAIYLDGFILGIPLLAVLLLLQKAGLVEGEGPSSPYLDEFIKAVSLAYYIVLHAMFGQTVGKLATGVKVVDKSEASDISWRQAVVRDIVPVFFFIASLLYVLAFGIPVDQDGSSGLSAFMLYVYWYSVAAWGIAEIVSMLFNRKRRAVHDLIAGTVVVRFARTADPKG